MKAENFILEKKHDASWFAEEEQVVSDLDALSAIDMAIKEEREQMIERMKSVVEKADNDRSSTGSYQDPIYTLQMWIENIENHGH